MMGLLLSAMTLGELLGPAAGPYRALNITDLTQDSREVEPGAAFVALAGSRTHGLRFAADALGRGAAIVLYEPAVGLAAPAPSLAVPNLRARLGDLARRFFGRDRKPVSLFGVTGTNGKTTVAYLVAQGMRELGRRCAYLGTLGRGTPPQLEPQQLTTPDCLSLHRSLRDLGVEYAALEVSSHALVQERIAGLEFHAAALTNLSRDHLDHHVDMATYAAAKRRLFDVPGLKRAVLNLDDAFAAAIYAELDGRMPIYGVSVREASGASVRGRVVASSRAGLELAVQHDGASSVIR
jgi:UDP-N-acetylmuramoyl-L-alanyl-D-glutamate--2,6-diaminopimelate ligase